MNGTLSELASLCFRPNIDDSYWFEMDNARHRADIGLIDTIKKYHGQQHSYNIIEKIKADSGLSAFPLNSEKLEDRQIGIFVDFNFRNKTPCVTMNIQKNVPPKIFTPFEFRGAKIKGCLKRNGRTQIAKLK